MAAEEQALRRQMQAESFKRDLDNALKREDVAKYYIDAGMDPKYVAHRYEVSLERCERYAAALAEQRAQTQRPHDQGKS
jgi:hypothetical protein